MVRAEPEAMASELNLPIRLVLIVGGTVAYLGLAILGEGGFAVFAQPALTALAIALFALSGAASAQSWHAGLCSGQIKWVAMGEMPPEVYS